MAAKSKSPTKRPAKTGAAPAAQHNSSAAPGGKLGALIALLRRPDGAQLDELMAATGWQAHSVRGAISGALKKKLGLTVTSEKTEAGRRYRIVEADSGTEA